MNKEKIELLKNEIARDCPLAGIEFNGVFNMPQDNEVES